MRILSVVCLLAFASVCSAGAVYHDGDFPGSFVVPDLTTAPDAPILFAPLEFDLVTNDIDTTIDYSFSYDLGSGATDFEGTMTLISVSGAIPGIAPSIATWSDFTAGSGIDGGYVTMNLFTQDVTPAYDPDALFAGRDAALVTFGIDAGNDPSYATIAVPEPQIGVLAGLGVLGLLCFRRYMCSSQRVISGVS